MDSEPGDAKALADLRRDFDAAHERAYGFAQPDEPDEDWYRSGVLGAAMWSPVDATRVGLTVRPFPAAPDTLDLDIRTGLHQRAEVPSGGQPGRGPLPSQEFRDFQRPLARRQRHLRHGVEGGPRRHDVHAGHGVEAGGGLARRQPTVSPEPSTRSAYSGSSRRSGASDRAVYW